jgi:FtsZ-interacting cell division protein YlmF
MDPLQAQRLVDFVAGAVQALEGRIERIGEGTVLCAPAGVEVSRG